MPKYIIKKEDLPDIDPISNSYSVRYRIVSENRNRYSAWSPIYSIGQGITYTTSGTLIIEKHSDYSTAVWDRALIEKDGTVIGDIDFYSVWIRWGNGVTDGEWQTLGRLSGPSINLIKPPAPAGLDTLSVEVYVPTNTSLRRAMYDVDQSNAAALIDLVQDTITLPENIFETGYDVYYESDTPIGGLTSGTNYYARMIDSTTMSLHPTEQDAIDDTNKIDLTANANSVGYFAWEGCTICDYLLYSNYNFSPV